MLVLIAELDLSDYFDIAVAVIAVCAFLACCRLGELTVPSELGFNPSRHVSRSVRFDNESIVSNGRVGVSTSFKIPWSKTTKELGALITVIDTLKLPFSRLLSEHLRINGGAPESGHLFAYKTSKGFVPMTKNAFLSRCYQIWRIHNMLLPLGHSFRIGGATEWLLAGLAPEVVAKIGRWKSLAFLLYWRRISEVLTRAVSKSYDQARLTSISSLVDQFRRSLGLPDKIVIPDI